MNILFVCTGNTCRSPMAEGLLRHMAEQEKVNIQVQSAGIAAFRGSPASTHTLSILKNKGISMQHQSQPVTDELLHWADLILTMTGSHKQVLSQQYPHALDKVFTLKEFTEVGGSLDIADPYGGVLRDYQVTEKELEEVLRIVLNKVTSF